MIQLLFSLRYQAQLRRTRPELYDSLEDAVVDAIKASGGVVGFERRNIAASFDEGAIGFWLEMLTVLETILKTMEDAASELYGYIGILGLDLGEEGASIVRVLPSGGGIGLWCDYTVQRALAPYAIFERPLLDLRSNAAAEGYLRIQSFKLPASSGADGAFPYRDRIQRILKQGPDRNAALTGKRFIGKRDGLRRYCAELLRGAPALTVTFGAGGRGLNCFVDAFTPQVRSFIAEHVPAERLEELDSLGALIFRERFRDQYSEYFCQRRYPLSANSPQGPMPPSYPLTLPNTANFVNLLPDSSARWSLPE
ncbi:hypothetical protein FACS189493_8060 [Spirochaetia bacterium]|nr:hypothetical protein FACS189493_8060 [Spirochaetia bacterium]